MRLRVAPLFVVLLPALSVACSGEDDGEGGKGNGTANTGAGGKAGSSGLEIGGRAGQAGKAGTAGASGAAGQSSAGTGGLAGSAGASGGAGKGGAGGEAAAAGVGGAAGLGGESGSAGLGGSAGAAGEAGAAGVAGQAGAGGSAGGPTSYPCDGVQRDPGEVCDGDAGPLGTCADYVDGAGGTSPVVTCQGCRADTSKCLGFRNGEQDGPESDVDCGSIGGTCGVGFGCVVDVDCDGASGARCVLGTCTPISVEVLGTIDVPQGTTVTHGLSLRTEVPLPADVSVTFVVDDVVGGAGLVATAKGLGAPFAGPHGRAGELKVSFDGTPSGQGLISGRATLKRGALTRDFPFTANAVGHLARMGSTLGPPTFKLGSCETATGDDLPNVGGVVDVPVGATICASFDPEAGAVVSGSLGGIAGTPADTFYQMTFVVPSAPPLWEGLPAVLPVELVAEHSGGWTTFGQTVRLTALTFGSKGNPMALGTPGDPRLATMSALTADSDPGYHCQLLDSVDLLDSATLARRVEGYAGATLNVITVNQTLTLTGNAGLENLLVSGNGLSTTGPCLSVSGAGPGARFRGVEVTNCVVGLEARGPALVVGANFHDNNVGLVLGDATGTVSFPPAARVLDTRVQTGSVGVHVEGGVATLRNVDFLDEGIGLDARDKANVTVVASTFTRGGSAVRTANVERVTLAKLTIDGKNATGALGLQIGGTTTLPPVDTVVRARNVTFRDLPRGAVAVSGESSLELAFSTIERCGSAVAPAIDCFAGDTTLLGTVVSASPELAARVGGNLTSGTTGRLALRAGSAIDGGKIGLRSELDGRLTLERAVLRGTDGPALEIASTAAFTLRHLLIAGQSARPTSAPLFAYRRPGGIVTGDVFEDVRLQAGVGAELVNAPGSTTCAGITDPVGGSYLRVDAGSTLCF